MRTMIAALALAAAAAVQAAPTQVQYLSGLDKDHRVDWEFQVNGGRKANKWSTIPVPSNWEMEGFGTYRYGDDWSNDPAPDSEGQYRHRFTVPASWAGQHIEIVFGAAMTDTRVAINGQQAGPVHQGGFYEFRYDVTHLVKPGQDNLLEVSVKRYSGDPSINRAERQSDYWLFAGIYRPVWLEAKPPAHIERVTLDARHDGRFSATAYLKGALDGKVSAAITTLDGKPVGRPLSGSTRDGQVWLSGRIAGIRPWSAEDPQRYRVHLRYERAGKQVHEVSRTIGYRTVELRPRDGLYVNDVKVRLKGANRHSIWPSSGRTSSRALSEQDARLMKDMNMNAVRMSHYPPDPHFLDVADEVGLYVIDELAGWQKAYDTAPAVPLVKELVQRDQHHPSVILWANGNEGGFNFELDKLYASWDPQKRPVIHPWAIFGGINTNHYPAYGCCADTLFAGREVFMPTEFLHGLYDGGAGAGLDDWWKAMLAHPLSAGGFIWAFADEGIVRADRNGAIDTAGNLAPDGIVGPYREKEGSYFAVKEVWSPVYLPLSELSYLAPSFDGRLVLENRYEFTNLKRVALEWQLVRFGRERGHTVAARGKAVSPDVAPGLRGATRLALPANWREQDALYLTARDPQGRAIYTWSWMIASSAQVAQRLRSPGPAAPLAVEEAPDAFTLRAGAVQATIDRATGYLRELKKGQTVVPLTNGPRLIGGSGSLSSIRALREGAAVLVEAQYAGELRRIRWRLQPDGALSVNYAYQLAGSRLHDAVGVTFDYPEQQVKSMRWLGKGPYRVWKNRTQGVEFDVWEKDYNDSVTGQSWNYPEFKGIHDKVYWARFATAGLPLTFVNHSDDVALRVFTPREAGGEGAEPKHTHVSFPPGDISFLNTLIPIGTKFRVAAETGPAGMQNRTPNLGMAHENTIDILIGD